MKRRIFLGVVIAAAGLMVAQVYTPSQTGLNAIAAQQEAKADNAVYGELLSRYLTASPDGVNRVDYAKWKASSEDTARLKAYIGYLMAQKPSAFTRDQAFAYWANLYNALTLQVVLDNYPVTSVKDIKSTGTGFFDVKAWLGPWRTKLVKVEGKDLSLDDIEHEIMRPTFKDPRVHYSVNCASIGCPNLKATPWTAETLEADLEAGAKAFINSPRGVVVGDGGKLTVSSIYVWFKEDFGGNDEGVIAHFRKYAAPELAKKLEGSPTIASNDYDWSLNQS
jgi:hypothetical protein